MTSGFVEAPGYSPTKPNVGPLTIPPSAKALAPPISVFLTSVAAATNVTPAAMANTGFKEAKAVSSASLATPYAIIAFPYASIKPAIELKTTLKAASIKDAPELIESPKALPMPSKPPCAIDLNAVSIESLNFLVISSTPFKPSLTFACNSRICFSTSAVLA